MIRFLYRIIINYFLSCKASPLGVLSLFQELIPFKILNKNRDIIEKYNYELYLSSLSSVSNIENNTNLSKIKINSFDNFNEMNKKNKINISKNPFDDDRDDGAMMRNDSNNDHNLLSTTDTIKKNVTQGTYLYTYLYMQLHMCFIHIDRSLNGNNCRHHYL